MPDCVLVYHLDDGSTVTKMWPLDDDRAAQLAEWLGEPEVRQMLTPAQSQLADELADETVIMSD